MCEVVAVAVVKVCEVVGGVAEGVVVAGGRQEWVLCSRGS